MYHPIHARPDVSLLSLQLRQAREKIDTLQREVDELRAAAPGHGSTDEEATATQAAVDLVHESTDFVSCVLEETSTGSPGPKTQVGSNHTA